MGDDEDFVINDSDRKLIKQISPEIIVLRNKSPDKDYDKSYFNLNENSEQHDFIEFEKKEYDVQKLFGKRNLSLIDDDPTEQKRREAKGFRPPKNPL